MGLKLKCCIFGAFLGALALPAARAQDIPPHGWSIRYSTNSLYLTRPDLPGIEVAVVSDIRPELSQEEKFENTKRFFAERAACPSLAQAETHNAFAGFSASSEDASRCRLLAMGHWRENGLQIALILNRAITENSILGGVPQRRTIPENGYSMNAVIEDVMQFFMMRYQMHESGVTVEQARSNLTAEWYANLVPKAHKPTHMVRLSHAYDAVADPRGGDLPALLLFQKRDGDRQIRFASACTDWDPAMFDPFADAFTLEEPDEPCERMFWRWKDGREGEAVEIKWLSPKFPARTTRWTDEEVVKENPELEIEGFYRPFEKGAGLDLRIGASRRQALNKIASGERPLSELASHELILLPDGRFMAGLLRAATLEGGRTSGPVRGQYYMDGHAITLVLESGHVIHGFAGWLPHKIERDFIPSTYEDRPSYRSAININGWIYSTYCRNMCPSAL